MSISAPRTPEDRPEARPEDTPGDTPGARPGDTPQDTPELRAQLKALILEATDKPAPAGGLADDEPLFGAQARLDLDSLDALQLSMALQQAFGIRMPDSKETRRAFASVAQLAQHLATQARPRRAGAGGAG